MSALSDFDDFEDENDTFSVKDSMESENTEDQDAESIDIDAMDYTTSQYEEDRNEDELEDWEKEDLDSDEDLDSEDRNDAIELANKGSKMSSFPNVGRPLGTPGDPFGENIGVRGGIGSPLGGFGSPNSLGSNPFGTVGEFPWNIPTLPREYSLSLDHKELRNQQYKLLEYVENCFAAFGLSLTTAANEGKAPSHNLIEEFHRMLALLEETHEHLLCVWDYAESLDRFRSFYDEVDEDE